MKHVELEKLPIDNLYTIRIAVQGHDLFYQDIRAVGAEQALRIAVEKALENPEIKDVRGGMPWRY